MAYPHGTLPTKVTVQPTPVYETLAMGLGAWVLWQLRDRVRAGCLFAIYLVYNGTLQVYERGGYQGSFGTYASGDKLRVERLSDGTVVYKKNGAVFYTSTTTSTGDLHADT